MKHIENQLADLNITVELINGYQCFSFAGKLIYHNTQGSKKRLQEQLEKAEGYIFDMSQLTRIDSTGFGVLINIAKQIGVDQNLIAIVISNSFIDDLFKIAKFNQLFPIVKNREEAIAVLKEGHSPNMALRDY